MDNTKYKPIEYKNFQSGIADSPSDGFANIRNCNIEKFPGNITPGFPTVSTNSSYIFGPVAVSYSSGTYITFTTGSATVVPYIGQAVVFSASGGGITAGTYYLAATITNTTGTTWTAQVAVNLQNALNQVTVNVTAGVTGNISSLNMATVTDFKTWYPNTIGSLATSFCIDNQNQVWVQDNTVNNTTIAITKNHWYYLQTINGNAAETSTSLVVFNSLHSTSAVFLFASAYTYISVMQIDGINLTIGAASVPNTGVSTPFKTDFKQFASGSAMYHKGFVSQTGSMYFTDVNTIYGFNEVSGKTFSPTDSTTYSYNNAAITLPSFEVATCLDNLGANLIVGGLNSNLLYPWTEIPVVTTTATSTAVYASYSTPLRVGERGTYQIKNINNVLYILAGIKGIVYYTTGYNVLPLKKIPEYITGGGVRCVDGPGGPAPHVHGREDAMTKTKKKTMEYTGWEKRGTLLVHVACPRDNGWCANPHGKCYGCGAKAPREES